MQINFAKKFKKQYEKADAKIKSAFDARLAFGGRDRVEEYLENLK